MDIGKRLSDNRDAILRLADQYGARNVRIFGSASRGEEGPDSDIDVLVAFEPGRSLLDHVALKQDLEDLLGCKIDLVSDKALHWYIRDQVVAQAVAL